MEYDKQAGKLLELIVERIEKIGLVDEIEDCEYNGEILIIDTNHGRYIINKQGAAKQVWMVSPISGPYHFSFQDNNWINYKGENILVILNNEFKEHIKIQINFTN